MPDKAYIGLDLGGTKILTAAADERGKILAREKVFTEVEGGRETILQNIYQSITLVIKSAGLHKDNIVRIGIGSPGPLDIEKGTIIESANLPWKNVPLIKLVQKKFGIKCRLQNDANTAALGEHTFGAGKDVKNMLYITVSTGIGGGIIIDNRLYTGVNGNAGEIGHIVIDPEGPQCGCGNHGCLEAFASGTAIAREGREAVRDKSAPELQKMVDDMPGRVNARLVAEAARRGDQKAVEIYDRAGYYLGLGLANLVNIFNPELIVFGGGVIKARDLFFSRSRDVLKNYALTGTGEAVKLKTSNLGDDIGVKGAIALAMQTDEQY